MYKVQLRHWILLRAFFGSLISYWNVLKSTFPTKSFSEIFLWETKFVRNSKLLETIETFDSLDVLINF
jgi:hypothetical protein